MLHDGDRLNLIVSVSSFVKRVINVTLQVCIFKKYKRENGWPQVGVP